MSRSIQVYLNQQTIEQLAALTNEFGDDSRVLQMAIEQLFKSHFPDAQTSADPEVGETMLDIHQLGSTHPESGGPVIKTIAGQQYQKSHYGHFYTVEDEGRTRALEGRFCEEIIFPVASQFAQYDGEWRYHFDEKSRFIHGVATVAGEPIPEDDTNGWYAMVMYIERVDPAAAQALPHNPHPDYKAD